jgi:hypothetical protein
MGERQGAETALLDADSVFRTVAPRPMKMGTIVSPWRYDVEVRNAIS